jgi:hypothetical protein
METRVVKISTVKSERIHTKRVSAGSGRLKTTEPTVRGRTKDIRDASQVPLPSVGQSRREKLLAKTVKSKQRPVLSPVWVPVISSTGTPLMPCRPAYARALIKSGRAQKRWFKGIFAIKMLDRSEGKVQQVVVGVDPGSKREAMTVQSKQHTYLNVLSDAVTWVGDRVEVRRNMRRNRRFRKTPCRKNRPNRNINCKRLPPSTKSRWQIKLNLLNFLKKLYPISDIVIEDIKAKTWKGSKKWNVSFSPLEVGKAWFYDNVSQKGNLIKRQGYETFEKRNLLGLKKSKEKLAENFEAHCVDSWVLSSFVTGKSVVDNVSMLRIIPLQLHRRCLHRFEPATGGIRSPYGGTGSMGLRRGSIVDHTELGMVYVGGTMNNKVSLHNMESGKRMTQRGSVKDCSFLHYNNWRTNWITGFISSHD